MKHSNIAIFVPHLGCPCDCSFCDQKIISGKTDVPTGEDVYTASKIAYESGAKNAQIAFFGGSFTAIDKDYMIELLTAAKKCVNEFGFTGIRISTRPDCITPEILDILKSFGATNIELGCQSMSDRVLSLNNRGHLAKDAVDAVKLIKVEGFTVGVQMMVGLYGSDYETDINTAKVLASLKPDEVRIYPTVILKGTYLAKLYEAGEYKPMDMDTGVKTCCECVKIFEQIGANILRVGLHASEDIKEKLVGGLYHPAFGQLCKSHLILEDIFSKIKGKSKIKIRLNPKMLSDVSGHRKSNLIALEKKGIKVELIIDKDVEKYIVER